MAIGLENEGFSDALVVLGAAGLVIPAFARFRISPVIGFILVGALVGPAGLGALTKAFPWLYYVTISDPEAIEPFAEFGIVLLLFSIGLELSFKRLWSMRQLVFGTGAAELLGSAALIATALHLLGQPWAGAAGLGLALSLSSTALVLPLVGTTSPVGRGAFAMLLFEDLALVPIIFALGAMAPSAGDGGWGQIAGVALRGGLTVIAIYLGGRFVLPRLFAQAARTKSPELFLAASLLVVIVASVATTAAGLSPIVGALLAGLLIAETEYHSEVEVITKPFQGLALGVFLITVGMSVDLRLILANWPSLLLAVLGTVLGSSGLLVFVRLGPLRGAVSGAISRLHGLWSDSVLLWMLGLALMLLGLALLLAAPALAHEGHDDAPGEAVAMPVGEPNPRMRLAQISRVPPTIIALPWAPMDLLICARRFSQCSTMSAASAFRRSSCDLSPCRAEVRRPSRSKAREMKIVSRAKPSVVVKICASTMLPPAAVQRTDRPSRRACASSERTKAA